MKTGKRCLMAVVVVAMLTFGLSLSLVSARYMITLPAGSFNISIAPSFSGIVTTPEELELALSSGQDFEVRGGQYGTIKILGENSDDGIIEVTINNATTTGRIIAGSNDSEVSDQGVEVVVNGVNATSSSNYVLSVYNGATMIVNSATITENGNVNGLVNVTGGSTLIINDGEFACASFAWGDSTSTIEINGGTFTIDNINGYPYQIPGYNFDVGTIIIRGGTFSIDPSNGKNVTIPEGYEVVKTADNTYVVVHNHSTTNWTVTSDTHSGTCNVCGEITEAHIYLDVDKTVCHVCGIADSGRLSAAIGSGQGTTKDKPIVISGGTWSELEPDNYKADLNFEISDGTFKGHWQTGNNNYFEIYGGTFSATPMWTSNATYVIYGGTFTTTTVPFYTDSPGTYSKVTIYGGDFAFTPRNGDTSAYFTIYGGNFAGKPDDECIAVGHKAVQNDDGTWTVME